MENFMPWGIYYGQYSKTKEFCVDIRMFSKATRWNFKSKKKNTSVGHHATIFKMSSTMLTCVVASYSMQGIIKFHLAYGPTYLLTWVTR